jgi:hypothetical protein
VKLILILQFKKFEYIEKLLPNVTFSPESGGSRNKRTDSIERTL